MRANGNEPKEPVQQELGKAVTIQSGQPAGTVVFDDALDSEIGDDWKGKTWLEGEGADLFIKGEVVRTSSDTSTIHNSFQAKGGKFLVTTEYPVRPWETVRPLPQRTYEFRFKTHHALYVPCNDVEAIYDFARTITVTSPDGTLHEAFFDPVTDGSAVAADSSIGQLEPAAFTDGNGAAATIQRIEWASDTVKVKVSPHTGLGGHRLDFIKLDGSVSLSLVVDEATVDATNGTLSWAVAEQPWHDGDLLMLRIKEILPEIALIDVPETITHGRSASFTVRAIGLSSAESYSIRLSTDIDHLGFGDGCGTISRTESLPTAITSHSATKTLNGCRVTTGTLSATLLQGTATLVTASADVVVEESTAVTVSLSRREREHDVARTNMTVQWSDPDSCDGRYFVVLDNSDEAVVRILGFHPAPATTSLSVELDVPWDDVPNDDRLVRVTCAPDRGNWRIVGEVPLRSGLP